MKSLYQIKIEIQNKYIIPVCRKSRLLSNLYYFAFSGEFGREHQKVLNGKYLHYRALQEKKINEYHLRREIHRLEKGLIMKNRKPVFAVDYILDVVENYKVACETYSRNPNAIDKEAILWAYAVLNKYFNSVSNHEVITKAKQVFATAKHMQEEATENNRHPFVRSSREFNAVNFEDLYKLSLQRRSVRWYLPKPVPRNLLEKAISLATLSPTACNRQPFEFRIFDNEALKNSIGSVPMGIKGFYENIPVFMVVVGKLSAYISERDRHIIYIDGGLASMSLMLALETLGLSSVPINWPDIESLEKKMDGLLQLKDDERPIMLIGVGYADPTGSIPYSQKKPSSALMNYN